MPCNWAGSREGPFRIQGNSQLVAGSPLLSSPGFPATSMSSSPATPPAPGKTMCDPGGPISCSVFSRPFNSEGPIYLPFVRSDFVDGWYGVWGLGLRSFIPLDGAAAKSRIPRRERGSATHGHSPKLQAATRSSVPPHGAHTSELASLELGGPNPSLETCTLLEAASLPLVSTWN